MLPLLHEPAWYGVKIDVKMERCMLFYIIFTPCDTLSSQQFVVLLLGHVSSTRLLRAHTTTPAQK